MNTALVRLETVVPDSHKYVILRALFAKEWLRSLGSYERWWFPALEPAGSSCARSGGLGDPVYALVGSPRCGWSATMLFGPVRSADHVLWSGERGCSSIPATSGLALVLWRNGGSRGLTALVIVSPYAWRTGGTLSFAIAVVLATSSSSPVLATLSAPHRFECASEASKRSHKVYTP